MNGAAPSYADAPRIVIWEMTRACALACRHCRAEAIPHRNPGELTTQEAFALVDEVSLCRPYAFVLTGGDPFMRDDLYDVVAYAVRAGLRTAVSPSATGRLRRPALAALRAAGARRISLSLDAPDAATHDAFRGVRGSFERTVSGIAAARDAGLEVQINTTIARFNHDRISEMSEVLAGLDVALWSLFFIVPVGRAQLSDVLDAQQTEAAFGEIARLARTLPFDVKTTEAPHYRRFLLQHGDGASLERRIPAIGDGKGFVFISHLGDICPSGFLPYVAGNVRAHSLLDVYREHPVMRRLRDPDTFSGKCGTCDYRYLCGGSRSRAYTMTGDPFASEPTCSYSSC